MLKERTNKSSKKIVLKITMSMTWAHASLYNPMTHGDLYPLYNVVWPHDPWGFVTIAASMTHGKKVAEPCET